MVVGVVEMVWEHLEGEHMEDLTGLEENVLDVDSDGSHQSPKYWVLLLNLTEGVLQYFPQGCFSSEKPVCLSGCLLSRHTSTQQAQKHCQGSYILAMTEPALWISRW